MDIDHDIRIALRDWDRVLISGVWHGCRYEEEYTDESDIQGVSRALVVPASLLNQIAQGDTIERVQTITEKLLGPYTVEVIEPDTDATVRIRLRDPG